MGRWLPEGNIEYLGRLDGQVKIRGNRVELGEIESQLRKLGMIKDCALLAKKDNSGNNILVAYYVAGDSFDKQVVIDSLKNILPDFSHYIS